MYLFLRKYSFWLGLILGSLTTVLWFLSSDDKLKYMLPVLLALLLLGWALLTNKKWLWYASVLCIPFSTGTILTGTGINLSMPSEILIAFMAMVGGIYMLKGKFDSEILKHPLSILIKVHIGWLFFTSIVSTDPAVSFKRAIIHTIFIVAFYFISAALARRNSKLFLKTFILYLIGLIPVMYWTFERHLALNFDLRMVFAMCQPYYNDHTIYAACIAFLMPLTVIMLRHSRLLRITVFWQIVLAIGFLLLVTQQALALSRAAWISLGAALLFYFMLKIRIKSWVVFSLVFILLGTGYLLSEQVYNQVAQNEAVSNDGDFENHVTSVTNVTTDASNLERINRWVCAMEMFKDKPITGFGPGTYQFEYGKYQTSEFRTYISTNHGDRGNAHSEFLTYLSETGLPGFLMYVAIVFYSIHLGMKNYYRTQDKARKLILLGVLLGLVSFFVHGCVNSFLDQDKMAFLVYSGLAVILVYDLQFREDKRSSTEVG